MEFCKESKKEVTVKYADLATKQLGQFLHAQQLHLVKNLDLQLLHNLLSWGSSTREEISDCEISLSSGSQRLLTLPIAQISHLRKMSHVMTVMIK